MPAAHYCWERSQPSKFCCGDAGQHTASVQAASGVCEVQITCLNVELSRFCTIVVRCICSNMHVCDFVVGSARDGPFVAAGTNFVVYGIYYMHARQASLLSNVFFPWQRKQYPCSCLIRCLLHWCWIMYVVV